MPSLGSIRDLARDINQDINELVLEQNDLMTKLEKINATLTLYTALKRDLDLYGGVVINAPVVGGNQGDNGTVGEVPLQTRDDNAIGYLVEKAENPTNRAGIRLR
jgi:hypothetical protein